MDTKSTAYKNQYAKEHYARVNLVMKPEDKVRLELAAAKMGCKSMSEFVRMCVDEALKDTPQE